MDVDSGRIREALEILNQVGPQIEAIAKRQSVDPARDVQELADLVNGVAVAARKIAEALKGVETLSG